jgi:hypothetical protein
MYAIFTAAQDPGAWDFYGFVELQSDLLLEIERFEKSATRICVSLCLSKEQVEELTNRSSTIFN